MKVLKCYDHRVIDRFDHMFSNEFLQGHYEFQLVTLAEVIFSNNDKLVLITQQTSVAVIHVLLLLTTQKNRSSCRIALKHFQNRIARTYKNLLNLVELCKIHVLPLIILILFRVVSYVELVFVLIMLVVASENYAVFFMVIVSFYVIQLCIQCVTYANSNHLCEL